MISIIVAKSENNCIGVDNNLPWHISSDLKKFKAITTGSKVIMGRKTFESIFDMIGKALPNRESIVITRNENFKRDDCTTVNSIEDALQLISKDEEAFIIGGAQIYEQVLPHADKLYITEVKTNIDGNKFFPDIDASWNEVSRENHTKNEKDDFDFDFVEYEKQ